MADITRPCDEISKDGLSWVSNLSGEDGLRAAAHHEMVLSAMPVSRLDDLSEQEEASCWGMAFSRARAYGKPAAIFINDGEPAAQTVGHVHFHVVGIDDPGMDIASGLFSLKQKFIGNAAPLPVAEARLSVSDPSFVSKFRALRADMKIKFGSDIGFSILPEKPSTSLENATFVLQVWTPQTKCAYGLTNMLRVMNGLRDRPYDWPVANLNRHFQMERKS